MTNPQFTTRRAVVGWIWLIFGLLAASLQPWDSSELHFNSISYVLGLTFSLAYIVISTLNKIMRITKHYNENLLLTSFVTAVFSLFCFSSYTGQLVQLAVIRLPGSSVLAVIWVLGWFAVDILDLWNAPHEEEHPLRH